MKFGESPNNPSVANPKRSTAEYIARKVPVADNDPIEVAATLSLAIYPLTSPFP